MSGPVHSIYWYVVGDPNLVSGSWPRRLTTHSIYDDQLLVDVDEDGRIWGVESLTGDLGPLAVMKILSMVKWVGGSDEVDP